MTESKLDKLREQLRSGCRPTKVDLSGERLDAFPAELMQLADCLEFLNLGNNNLSALPLEITSFSQLRILFFGQNRFEEVPTQLGKLPRLRMLSFKSNLVSNVSDDCLAPSLEWLILTDNRIQSIPKSIGKLSGLRKLLLAGNQLSCLPDEMRLCQQLELVRLASNRLRKLPDWLPSLPRLSWLAFAGNDMDYSSPGQSSHCASSSSSSVSWESLSVQQVLGEGASGTVFRVHLAGSASDSHAGKDCALKVFRGEITSDGLAEDEIKVNEHVGEHPSFINVIGRVRNHPDGLPALLFPLLPPDMYKILGGPPSFDSITRDTFPDHTTFSLAFTLRTLLSVASACNHLASLQILHGDVYAHNILGAADGTSLLTDFGAASFYPRTGCDSDLLHRIEVRAFGCLVEDMLSRLCTCPSDSVETIAKLQALREACFASDVRSRPSFEAILLRLQSLCV